MIGWERHDEIAVLTVDRGGARNAIPIAGWDALAQTAHEIGTSNARAVILRSAMPGVFSAGADLAEFRQLVEQPPLRKHFREAMHAGIEAVAALPMPVIAAIDGGCFGAAVALALACDIVVAGDEAVFATTPAKLGLTYPASDVARLKARIGEGHAALMLFSGVRIDADEAARIGVAHRRVAHAQPAAHELANAIAANVPEAVRALKSVLRDPAAEEHARAFDDAFGSAAFSARLDAFLGGKR
jgi:enoyl-CoA hydratase/carnithine racemase